MRQKMVGLCTLYCWLVLAGCAMPAPDIGQLPSWAQTAWVSIHRDARNSDHSPYATTAQVEPIWRALEGAAVLVGPAIGPDGTLYVTSGQGPGHSHLHALAPDGTLRWQSAPQTTLDDLDSFVVASGVLIDHTGDLYVSDSNQFWAFHPDGSVKWVSDLPVAGEPFISALLTAEGWVGGITTGGRVVFFEAENGDLAMPVAQLPAGVAPAPVPHRRGLWEGGLLDPALLEIAENTFFGLGVQVANTPAIHPQSGRIFITAAGPQAGEGLTGRLYGLDLAGGALTVATETAIGSGSGSSPTIAPNGDQVYAVDGSGLLVSVDPSNGEILWTSPGFGPSASVAVGPDGTIYSGSGTGSSPGLLNAVNPDGTDRWRANYDAVAAAALPAFDPIPPFFPTGQPTAKVDSVISVSANHLWVVLILGYDFVIPPSVRTHQSRLAVLAAIDPASGDVIATVPLPDTSEATITIGADGRLYTAHAALLSSIFYYGINPLLPPPLQIAGPPSGGLTALSPGSPSAQVLAGLRQADRDLASAQTALAAGDRQSAVMALERSLAQLQASGALMLQTDSVVTERHTAVQSSAGFVQSVRLVLRIPWLQPDMGRFPLNAARLQLAPLLEEGQDP